MYILKMLHFPTFPALGISCTACGYLPYLLNDPGASGSKSPWENEL